MNVLEENKVYFDSFAIIEPVMELRSMFAYDNSKLKISLESVLRENSAHETWNWLQEKASAVQSGNVSQLNAAFAAMPRKTGKKMVTLTSDQEKDVTDIRNNFSIHQWS